MLIKRKKKPTENDLKHIDIHIQFLSSVARLRVVTEPSLDQTRNKSCVTPAKVRFVQFPVLMCARSLISPHFLVSLVQEQHAGAAPRHKGSMDNLGGPAE